MLGVKQKGAKAVALGVEGLAETELDGDEEGAEETASWSPSGLPQLCKIRDAMAAATDPERSQRGRVMYCRTGSTARAGPGAVVFGAERLTQGCFETLLPRCCLN